MNRKVSNAIVGIFAVVLLVVGLRQGMASWGTGLLGMAVGLMVVTVFPWHAKGPVSAGSAFALKFIGGLILLAILIAGIATDWTPRETALMGIAVGGVHAAAVQSRSKAAA